MSTFSADITAFCELTALRGDVVVRKLALEGLKGVVKRTPVDTGRARGSWRVGINTTDLSVEQEKPFGPAASKATKDAERGQYMAANTQAATQKALSEGTKAVLLARWGQAVYITNNLVYVPALEIGHSKQAPAGMLAVTVAQLEMHLTRIVAEARDAKTAAGLLNGLDGGPP